MNKLLSVSVFLCLIFSGCVTESAKDKNKALLLGKWDVKEAIRNGKITDALNGMYFEFLPEDRIISNFNLSVEEREGLFTLEKMILTEQNKVDIKRVFTIEQIEEKHLVLSTEYQEMNFKLSLVRRGETVNGER